MGGEVSLLPHFASMRSSWHWEKEARVLTEAKRKFVPVERRQTNKQTKKFIMKELKGEKRGKLKHDTNDLTDFLPRT